MAENRSRTSVGRRWSHFAVLASTALAGLVAAAVLACASASPAFAQGGEGNGSTYQRKSSFAGHGHGHHGDWRRREFPQYSSQVSAGSFQRPYPYHLDYYRMKYGGSYAPYFGNLYGPPIYNFFGTPFYGGYGSYSPYYGGGGFPASEFGGYGLGGPGYGGPFCGAPSGVPYGPWAGEFEVPAAPVEGAATEESLPAF